MTVQYRTAVIGLDGATLDLVEPWAAQGRLPTLKRLMDEGRYGPLTSTFPPLTGPAWSTFMTGRSPARHGVVEFFRRQQCAYRQILNSRRDVDGRSLWRILSDAGRSVGVMGVPITYPPEAVNGFLISGLLTPPGRRDFTHPPELLDELEANVGPYRLHHNEKYHKRRPLPMIREQHEILENNTRAALYLMEHKPWDFFMVHFLGTDLMQHEFWHVMDEQHPRHDPEERKRLGNPVLDYYVALDAALGRLLEGLGDDTVVIVMSDHGFGRASRFISMNTWLLEQGLLCLRSDAMTRVRRALFRLGLNYSSAARAILAAGVGRYANAAGRARRESFQRRLFLSLDDVDWSRTRAYSIGNFGQIFINQKGREPEGIVQPGPESEALLRDLTERLQLLVDPSSGERVIERVFRREELYDGPYIDRCPDLAFLTRDMEYKAMGLADFPSPRVFETVYGTSGHHRMDGLLICAGEGVIGRGDRVQGARIQDLAPTILHLMGEPVPRDMDGRVLLDILTPEFLGERAVAYSGEEVGPSGDGTSAYTPEEEADLVERLRALGYAT